jgi:hypothetical protein
VAFGNLPRSVQAVGINEAAAKVREIVDDFNDLLAE